MENVGHNLERQNAQFMAKEQLKEAYVNRGARFTGEFQGRFPFQSPKAARQTKLAHDGALVRREILGRKNIARAEKILAKSEYAGDIDIRTEIRVDADTGEAYTYNRYFKNKLTADRKLLIEVDAYEIDVVMLDLKSIMAVDKRERTEDVLRLYGLDESTDQIVEMNRTENNNNKGSN